MTDTTGALPPAGWYPDPYGAPFERWWDGQQWTEHTNTPAAPEPLAPVQVAPVQVAPVQPEPYIQPEPYAQPEPYGQQDPYAQPEPYRQPEPSPYAEPVAPVSAAYVPPALDEPYGAPADPFAGFVTASHNPAESTVPPAAPAAPEPAPYQPEAYQPEAYQQPAYQPEAYEQPAAFQPAPYDAPAFATPEPAPYAPPAAQPIGAPPVGAQQGYQPYTPPAQGYDATPGAPSGNVGANPPSSFDFGFGAIVSGEAGSGGSHESGDGDSGLFGSWAPDEYVEPSRNGPASAGLALGILSFFLSAVAGIPGLIVSAVGIGKAARLDQEGNGPVGRGKAVTGLILSILGTGATAALIVLYGLPLLAGLPQPNTADDGTNTPDTSDEVELTQNGGIPLDTGAIGMIVLPDSTNPAIQFSVASITPNFTCTADAAGVVAPANGQYVAVAINITTDENYLTAMDGGTPLHMSQSDWIGFLPDENGTQVINTDGGNSCISAAEQFPADIPAGANVSGTIVLDMAADVFSLSWGPSGVTNLDPGITRWEWAMPVE